MAFSIKHILLGTGVVVSLVACVVCWRMWLAGQSDPSLTGDPRAYARATGIIMTPAGMRPAAAFSDGPGRIPVADALGLVDNDLVGATALLGKPDALLSSKTLTVALWWNAVIPDKPDDTQPPDLHLRLDLPSATGRIARVTCLGALLADMATAPR